MDLVVVNHNTRDKLQRLLDTLHADDDGGWNLYIVDNGSTDGSVDWLLRETKPYRIQMMKFNDNIGFSAAVNDLVSRTRSPLVGILNGDVWLSSSDVKQITKAFDDSEIAILGPKQRDEKGYIRHGGIIGTNESPKLRGWGEHDPDDVKYKDRIECVSVSGSAYFIRRSVWDNLTNCPRYRDLYPSAVGAFLSTPHYYEETWCSYHAREHGYKIFYDGSISIGHSWHASSEVGSTTDANYARTSRALFRQACGHHGIKCD